MARRSTGSPGMAYGPPARTAAAARALIRQKLILQKRKAMPAEYFDVDIARSRLDIVRADDLVGDLELRLDRISGQQHRAQQKAKSG